MTDAAYAHYTVIADRSGSTGRVTDPGRTRAMDFTDGIRALIQEQAKAPGKTTISLVEFSSTARLSAPGKGKMQLKRVAWFTKPGTRKLAEWCILPYGNTPLLDAVGTVITDTGQALEQMPEDRRPGRVYVIIATDGEENSSTEYTRQQIRDMVSHQRDVYGWECVFIGADIDAFSEAGDIGIAAASTLQTNTSSTQSVLAAYSSTSEALLRGRATGQAVSYSDTERDAANQ